MYWLKQTTGPVQTQGEETLHLFTAGVERTSGGEGTVGGLRWSLTAAMGVTLYLSEAEQCKLFKVTHLISNGAGFKLRIRYFVLFCHLLCIDHGTS